MLPEYSTVHANDSCLRLPPLCSLPFGLQTFRAAVYAAVRCGDGASALEVLEAMVHAGHAPCMPVTKVLVKVRSAYCMPGAPPACL